MSFLFNNSLPSSWIIFPFSSFFSETKSPSSLKICFVETTGRLSFKFIKLTIHTISLCELYMGVAERNKNLKFLHSFTRRTIMLEVFLFFLFSPIILWTSSITMRLSSNSLRIISILCCLLFLIS